MSDPTKDPSILVAFWAMLPEPAKAAILNFMLGAVMAFRNRDKSFLQGALEVTAGSLITLLAGHACLLFGMSPGWTYAVAGGLAIFGVDQSKALILKFVNRKYIDEGTPPSV